MTTLTLLIFLFPLAYSPGPGNLFFAALGARAGWRAALPALTGYHVATLGAALAVGAGLLLLTGPVVARALAWAGTAYMLWLALKLWRAGAVHLQDKPPRATLMDGAALLLLNPKAWAIMAAMFAQYPQADWATVAQVAVIFTLNNAVAFAVWTLAGDTILGRLRHAVYVNRAFALVLAAVALRMALV